MASKAMWEVDPETRSKVTPLPSSFPPSILSSIELTYPQAPRDPKNRSKRPVLRLRGAVSAMGVPQVRDLYLSELCGRTQGAGSAY